MKAFLKRLFKERHRTIKVLLLDDSSPGKDNSYILKPNSLFGTWVFTSIALAFLVALIFMLTPLGGLLYSSDEAEIRGEIENISERLLALQDSLDVRDRQLLVIKDVIRTNKDTTLAQDQKLTDALVSRTLLEGSNVQSFENVNVFDEVNNSDFLTSNIIKSASDFPSRYPTQGTNTRGFEPRNGHFGIDIATKKDQILVNVADGTVISSSWTLDYGYVLSIQHSEGLVSTYKHCSKLYKQEGDNVLKGDMLGLIGDTGISSSGPHLHFEIWKNGVPQNPLLYLIQ